MRHTSKLFVLLVAATLVLSLSGCNLLQKSATPPIETLEPEDDSNAQIEDASDPVTEDDPVDAADSTAEDPADTESEAEEPADTEAESEEPADTTEETLDPTPTALPTIEPSPTAVPVTTEPEDTAEATPDPTTAPVVATDGKHTVQAGENLFRIALKYGLTTNAVAQANNITNPALVYVGQVLTIPSGGTGIPTTPAPSGKTHVVQAGENLFRIALKYGVDQNHLASYNGITNPALIYVGQVLQIP